MKKLIIGSTLGLVIGGGAMLGVMQIPSVNKAMLKPSTDTNIGQDLETQNKINNLELNNSKLKQDIENLNTKLTDCNAELETTKENLSAKELECTTLAAEKSEIQALLDKLQNVDLVELENANAELSAELLEVKAELDSYKELVGSDISYIEMVGVLQQDLANKTSQLESATAELEQLRVDKTTLETKVVDLETELAEVKEELKNYKSLDDIDILNIDNFNGKWYLNGTFEDYYIINNGIVTHNANEDTGVIQCLNNQVYLFMNNSSSIPVDLSVDGNSFVDNNGNTYQKFYINTSEAIITNLALLSGTYNSADKQITLNSDNTLTYYDGIDTYYGAYTSTSIKKNIGGNISVIDYVKATIHLDNEDLIINFEKVVTENDLIDVDNNVVYSLSKNISGTMLYSKATEYSCGYSSYIKIILKLKKPIKITSKNSVQIVPLCTYKASASNVHLYFNNLLTTTTSNFFTLYNSSAETIETSFIELRLLRANTETQLIGFQSVGGVDCDVVYVENVNNAVDTSLGGKLKDVYDLYKTKNYVSCDTIQDYVNGIYSNDDISINITSDSTIVSTTGLEDITATSVVTSSQTDGTDIYQTTTITYSTIVDEVETEHTLVINLVNDNYVSSTLDSVAITLSKN